MNEQETWLFQGHAEDIAAHLRQEAQQTPSLQDGLLKEAGYFENNKRRIDYLDLRIHGWVIGSGMGESGGKQFKHRGRTGAERMPPVRSAILSCRFDKVWKMVRNSPQN